MTALTSTTLERCMGRVLGAPAPAVDELVATLDVEGHLALGVALVSAVAAARTGTGTSEALADLAAGRVSLPTTCSAYEARVAADEVHDDTAARLSRLSPGAGVAAAQDAPELVEALLDGSVGSLVVPVASGGPSLEWLRLLAQRIGARVLDGPHGGAMEATTPRHAYHIDPLGR